MRIRVLVGLIVLAIAAGATYVVLTRDPNVPAELAPDANATFFDDLASLDLPKQQAALALTVPGSPARRYVRYQLDLTRARVDGQVTVTASEATRTNQGWQLCTPSGAAEGTCSIFSRVVREGGKVRSFRVDGDDVRDNLLIAGGTAKRIAGVGSVQLLSAYLQPGTHSYWVVLRVTAGSRPVSLRLKAARYLVGDGAEVAPSAASQPRSVAAGRSSTAVLVFGHARPGGVVRVPLSAGGASGIADLGGGTR